MKNRLVYLLIFICITIVTGSLIWNIRLIQKNNRQLVLNKLSSVFEQLVNARSWNSAHGGVYVIADKNNPPNPYLEDSLRDLTTREGLLLTKINPAYMTRQLSDINTTENDLQFHITSLDPLRPANKPTDWEREALQKFGHGVEEVLELIHNDSIHEYRYMAPLVTRKSCLQCHAKQGYSEGDIRGGIRLSFSSDLHEGLIKKSIACISIVHLIILLAGIFGILFLRNRINKYHRSLAEKNLQLKHSNETKGMLFSVIAHDIRSPFSALIGITEVLKNNFRELNEHELERLINGVHSSTKNTYDLLQNVLDWAKSQLGSFKSTPEECNLPEVVNEIENIYNLTLHKKKISLKAGIEKHFTVIADKNMLRLILRNLISNAVKFSEIGGMIMVTAEKIKGVVKIRVMDQGVGIEPERIPKLFTIDESAHTLGTMDEQGTGLGLVLTREFVKKHNGEIEIESEKGKGTTVSFTLK